MKSDKNIEHFAQLARAYCTWAEGDRSAAEQEAATAIKYLLDLLAGVLRLPELCGDEQALEIEHAEWQRVYQRFGALPFNYYAQLFDPHIVPAEESGIADLADDLADIWRDLKSGLVLFDAGCVAAAVWEWRNGFHSHWGHHATGAVFALHCWLRQGAVTK